MSSFWSKWGQHHPVITLSVLFAVWKSLIAVSVLAAPGIGYDTSTSLASDGASNTNLTLSVPDRLSTPWLKFVRWDALYYTHMADQGHVFEQEWAWGIGLSTALSWTAEILSKLGLTSGSSSLVAGLLLSHASHWFSVIQLWILTRSLIGTQKDPHSRIAFTAAAFHIISPAGVFLSSPYSESPFSFLSMTGFTGYVYAIQHFDKGQVFAGAILMICSGAAFGTATMVRSNGILSGIPFLYEAIVAMLSILFRGPSGVRFTRLASVIIAGLVVASGMAYPQILAHKDYCSGRDVGTRRPWCERTIPSIFTWVQSHYWNVGPFRYWTLSNLPLFLLAAPSLALLTYSAADILQLPEKIPPEKSKSSDISYQPHENRLLKVLAVPQLVLAFLALTTYHVQIITRLSSGYPLWYIWLAMKAQEDPKKTSPVLRWMVLYALIQAGLYASFLPPA